MQKVSTSINFNRFSGEPEICTDIKPHRRTGSLGDVDSESAIQITGIRDQTVDSGEDMTRSKYNAEQEAVENLKACTESGHVNCIHSESV